MRFTTVYGPDTRDNMMYGLLRDKKATYVTNHKKRLDSRSRCLYVPYDFLLYFYKSVPIGYGESVPVKSLAEKVWSG